MKTYFLIACRRLYREKLYAFISVLSLAIAMAAVIVVGSYIHFELSFDKYHDDYQSIFRVTTNTGGREGSDKTHHSSTPQNWGRLFVEEYPDVGISVEFDRLDQPPPFQYQDQLKSWSTAYYVDSTVFKVFHHDILYGDPQTVFDNPDSIAISEQFAQFYFGDDNPIGKQILNEGKPAIVGLVFRDIPENSHIRYDILLPVSARPAASGPFDNAGQTINFSFLRATNYLKLKPEFDIASFSKLSGEFVKRHGTNITKSRGFAGFNLQAIERIHLLDNHVRETDAGANLAKFFGIAAIGLLILVVGCINTINLNTARASRTLSLLSMQRLLGANRSMLMTQSLCESIVLAFFALVLGICIVEIAANLQLYQLIGGPSTILRWKATPGFTLLLLSLCLLVAFLSALYPAWNAAQLSNQSRTANGLKNSGLWSRSILVSLQLVLAVGSIAGALLLLDQIRYLNEKDLGFHLDNRLAIFIRGRDREGVAERLQNELATVPDVLNVTHSGWIPSGGNFFNLSFSFQGQGERQSARVLVADDYLFDTLGITVKETLNPNGNISNKLNQNAFVNEAFIENINWDRQRGSSPLGQVINIGNGQLPLTIGGIFEDFHSRSLYQNVEPIIVVPKSLDHPIINLLRRGSPLIVHYNTNNEQTFLENLSQAVAKHNPAYPVDYVYLEDNWNALYGDDQQIYKQILLFSSVAIMLALMGLFGLAAYNTQARQREISIRKVIGASTLNNLLLIGKGILIIAILASIPALLGIYKLYSLWLDRFAYQVEFTPTLMVLASVIVIVLSQATVLSQSWRASQRNPAETLRYE